MFDSYLPEQDGAICVVPSLSAIRFLKADPIDNRLCISLYTYADGFTDLRVSGVVLSLEDK